MLEKKKINNYFVKLLKKKYNQYEIQRWVLSSIRKNQKIKPRYRVYAFYKIQKIRPLGSISRQFSVCFESGKNKSIINHFNRSRQITKLYGLRNKLPSIRVKSW